MAKKLCGNECGFIRQISNLNFVAAVLVFITVNDRQNSVFGPAVAGVPEDDLFVVTKLRLLVVLHGIHSFLIAAFSIRKRSTHVV